MLCRDHLTSSQAFLRLLNRTQGLPKVVYLWVSFGFFSSPDSRATYEFVSGLSRDGDFSSALQRGIRVFLSAGRSTSGVSGQDSGAAVLSAPDEGWAPGQALPSAQSAAQGLWVPPENRGPGLPLLYRHLPELASGLPGPLRCLQ